MLLVLFLAVNIMGQAQPLAENVHIRDLRENWKVLGADNVLQHYPRQEDYHTNTIYFTLEKKETQGRYLHVNSYNPVSLFLNNQLLICRAQPILMDLDSLMKTHPLPWLFGLYQREGVMGLSTTLISPKNPLKRQPNQLRAPSYFMSFTIIALLILFAFLAALLRHHRQSTLRYLNFFDIFSLREQKKHLLENSLFRQSNILHYLFSGLLSAFVLLTIFHFAIDNIPVAAYFLVRSTSEACYQWIKLSGIIIALGLAKFIVIWLVSTLFNFQKNIHIQFYNYVKLLLFIFSASGMICLIYFAIKTISPEAYTSISYGIACILLFWPIVVGAKLSNRSPCSYSHIFFYLCASEFIPTIVIVQVLTF